MAYVSKEFDHPTLPATMGLYLSSTVLGGTPHKALGAGLAAL